MKMRIKIANEKFQPNVYIDPVTGKINEIEIDAPFILVTKNSNVVNKDKVLEVEVTNAKVCNDCKLPRNLNQYYNSTQTSTGSQNTCITCIKRRKEGKDEDE